MNRLAPALVLAATLLAGCNQESHTIVAGPDDQDPAAAALQANGPVALPPTIMSTKTYRCGADRIFHVNWMSDGKSATIRTEQNGSPVLVSATEDGEPMTAASGHAISGTAADASVKITLPGGPALSCQA